MKSWKLIVVVLAAAVLWLAVWVFAEMLDDTPKGQFDSWDTPVLKLVRGGPGSPHGGEQVATVARGVTFFGSTIMLATLSVGALVLLGLKRRWRAVIVIAAAISLAQGMTTLLKVHFDRTRPTATKHLVEENSWSFPSGHALMSSVVYLLLGVVLARHVQRRRSQVAIIAAAFVACFLIGVSRLYLGVHYPTDVLAGWSGGTAWAIISSAVLIWLDKRHRPTEPHLG